MSWLLAIPLTLFILFIMPIWLWLHYSQRSSGHGNMTEQDKQHQQQLLQQSIRLQERVKALEEILDIQHPNWRDQ